MRRRIASCWRSKRFSTTRLAFDRNAEKNPPMMASTSANIVATVAQKNVPVSGESATRMLRSSTPVLAYVPKWQAIRVFC